MTAAKIRPATTQDAARVRAVARAAYAKYVERMGREPPPMLADFPALIAKGVVVLVEDDRETSGYMVAWPEADAYLIDNIAIDPAKQGRGLGSALIAHAVSETRRLRLPAIQLYTHVTMTENLAIYSHLGFVETNRTNDNGLHRVHMRLHLTS